MQRNILKFLLFVCLILLVSSQECVRQDQGTTLDNDQFAISGTNEDEKILVCTCPYGSTPNSVNKTCDCTDSLRIFNSNDCICQQGYYETIIGECLACNLPCTSCSSVGICEECVGGYFLSSTNECLETTNLIGNNCMKGCQICNSTTECSSCLSGYQKTSQNKCSACSSHCKTCSSSTVCTTCNPYYYLDSNDKTCKSCSNNCIECDQSGCLTCQAKYYVKTVEQNGVTEKNCTSCSDPNCIVCPEDICFDCEARHVMLDSDCSDCVECLEGCSVCSTGDLTICLGCSEGFYLTSSSTCETCQDNCKICTSLTNCTVCMKGYEQSGTDCILSCTFPCKTCLSTDPTHCSSCQAGYTQLENQCKAETDCSSCETCPLEYYLSNGRCIACGVQNCANCQQGQNSTKTCIKCLDEYLLNDQNACVACPTECTVCTTSSYCTECKDGYFLEDTEEIKTGKCLQCDANYFCKTCTDNSQNCLSCMDGYSLSTGKCISKVLLTFQLQLIGEYNGFFEIINAFKENILERLSMEKTNRHLVTIKSLKSGSVIIDGTVSVSPTSKTVGEMSSSLQSSLTQNSQVGGGYKISSSSISYNDQINGNDFHNNSAPQTGSGISDELKYGLIIAFSVFGATILTLVLVGGIYARRKLKEKQTCSSGNSNTEQNKQRFDSQKQLDNGNILQ